MARFRLIHARTKPGWLALLLAVMVISLCLSQRMGLKIACAIDHHTLHTEQVSGTALAANTDSSSFGSHPNASTKDTVSDSDHDSCSLSEQLLSKVFQHLDPLFIVSILLFALWLAPMAPLGYLRRPITPLLFSGRRRHLVLCVFRE